MAHKCEVREQAAQPKLSIRVRSNVEALPQEMGRVFGAILAYLGELGEQPGGMPFAAYYNMDMQDLDVEIGFPVARELPGKGDIQAGEIPAGMVASCVHVGPYREVGPVYDELTQWIGENGYQVAGPPYEWYLNDPGEDQSKAETRVAFPVKAV